MCSLLECWVCVHVYVWGGERVFVCVWNETLKRRLFDYSREGHRSLDVCSEKSECETPLVMGELLDLTMPSDKLTRKYPRPLMSSASGHGQSFHKRRQMLRLKRADSRKLNGWVLLSEYLHCGWRWRRLLLEMKPPFGAHDGMSLRYTRRDVPLLVLDGYGTSNGLLLEGSAKEVFLC